MPDTINGLPLHPLVVHAVVVLLPLAALGVVALAIRPTWRPRYGTLVIVVTALATLSIPLATESGESLERQVGDPGTHAQLGDTLIWFAVPLLAAAVGMLWLDRRSRRATGGAGSTAGRGARHNALGLAVPALAALLAVANLVQVYRIGESGARAAWGSTGAGASSTQPR